MTPRREVEIWTRESRLATRPFGVGDMANAAGDIWLAPNRILQCGRIAVWQVQAGVLVPKGWRIVEWMNDGRALLERRPRSAIIARCRANRAMA